MNLYNKIKNYLAYRKIVQLHEPALQHPRYALRVDALCRMYTVINLQADNVAYGPDMTRDLVKEYLENAVKMFNSIGLFELVSLYTITKLNEFNYLVVFGYQYMDPKRMMQAAVYGGAGLAAAGLVYALVTFLSRL
jgi:hypothetical protein